jgi:hypothetical protein
MRSRRTTLTLVCGCLFWQPVPPEEEEDEDFDGKSVASAADAPGTGGGGGKPRLEMGNRQAARAPAGDDAV